MAKNNAGKEPVSVQDMQAALASFREEVKVIVELGLKSKSVALKKLLPSLDELNRLGFSQEKLVEEMNEAKLEMSLGYFKTAIWRLRKEAEAEQAKQEK